jgi:hypothetical protein
VGGEGGSGRGMALWCGATSNGGSATLDIVIHGWNLTGTLLIDTFQTRQVCSFVPLLIRRQRLDTIVAGGGWSLEDGGGLKGEGRRWRSLGIRKQNEEA